MHSKHSIATIIFAGLLAIPAFAQPPAEDGAREPDGDRPRRGAPERILRAFDKDNDGRLNDEERAAMREQLGDRFERLGVQLRERVEERRDDDGREREGRRDAQPERRRDARDGDQRERDARRDPGRPRDADRPRRPDRPRDADRPSRPDRAREMIRRREAIRALGPIGPMGVPRDRDLGPLFGWFDLDGDNMLSRREFEDLSHFVARRRPGPPRGPGGPVGARIGRRGPDGPPGRPRERLEIRLRERRLEGRPGDDRPAPRQREERRIRRDEPRRPSRPDNPPDRPRPDEPRRRAAEAI